MYAPGDLFFRHSASLYLDPALPYGRSARGVKDRQHHHLMRFLAVVNAVRETRHQRLAWIEIHASATDGPLILPVCCRFYQSDRRVGSSNF